MHKMQENGRSVLFSPVGTTDPISYQREGALLHICRHYHPECVVLYLSQEMLAQQQKDDRYRRSLRLLAEEEGFETEILCEERPEMDSPHLFDVFYEDFERCIHTLHERYPGRRILLNLSSGTPAMKSALAVLPYLIDLPVCGIQVSSPQKAHNDKREPLQEYDVDLAWEYNLDRKSEEFVDRCKEPKMENLRAKLQRRTLEAHLKVYDYAAALEAGLQMGNLLPDSARELLQAAALRARNEWEKIESPLCERLVAQGSLEEKAILEYMFSLQALQQRGEVAEFLRGLTPALYQLSLYALKKLGNIDLEACRSKDGKLYLSHARTVVIDASIAEQGIGPLVRALLARSDVRLTLRLAVARDVTADEIVRAQAVVEDIPGEALGSLLDGHTARGELPDLPLCRVADRILSGGDFSLPAVTLTGDGRVIPAGQADFRLARMTGFSGGDSDAG